MEANVKSAVATAGVYEAGLAAKQANGDYGVLLDARTNEVVRRATEDDARRSAEAAGIDDPDGVFTDVGGRRVYVTQ